MRRTQIQSLDEIGALPPSEWYDKGRLFDSRRRQPFSYVNNNGIIFIHDFRHEEVYVYNPDGVAYVPSARVEQKIDEELLQRMVAKYHELPVAVEHNYLTRKNIPSSDKVKLGKNGELVVPMVDLQGNIRSFQRIFDSRKLFIKNYPTKGLFYTEKQKFDVGEPIFLCEGYATYKTLQKYIEFEGLACFSKANMFHMQQVLSSSSHIVVVLRDLDIEYIGEGYFLPPVYSDWNDTEQQLGERETRERLEHVNKTLLLV